MPHKTLFFQQFVYFGRLLIIELSVPPNIAMMLIEGE